MEWISWSWVHTWWGYAILFLLLAGIFFLINYNTLEARLQKLRNKDIEKEVLNRLDELRRELEDNEDAFKKLIVGKDIITCVDPEQETEESIFHYCCSRCGKEVNNIAYKDVMSDYLYKNTIVYFDAERGEDGNKLYMTDVVLHFLCPQCVKELEKETGKDDENNP